MAVFRWHQLLINMISEGSAYAYCCEDISKIENYDKAIADKTQTWVCHHRKEILDDGTKVYGDELKKQGLYYHRPASELVFMTKAEHNKIHNARNTYHKGKRFTEETKQRMSQTRKGRIPWNKGKQRIYSKETLERMSKSHMEKPSRPWLGKHLSNETKKKLSIAHKNPSCETSLRMSAANKGLHWYNNGVYSVRARKCPLGFNLGRLKSV